MLFIVQITVSPDGSSLSEIYSVYSIGQSAWTAQLQYSGPNSKSTFLLNNLLSVFLLYISFTKQTKNRLKDLIFKM